MVVIKVDKKVSKNVFRIMVNKCVFLKMFW